MAMITGSGIEYLYPMQYSPDERSIGGDWLFVGKEHVEDNNGHHHHVPDTGSTLRAPLPRLRDPPSPCAVA